MALNRSKKNCLKNTLGLNLKNMQSAQVNHRKKDLRSCIFFFVYFQPDFVRNTFILNDKLNRSEKTRTKTITRFTC